MPESFYVTWCYCVPKIIYVRVSSRCSFSFNEKPGTFSENFCLWPEAVQKRFIQNGVLKICTKFTEEHQRYITMLLKWHFQLWSVNLLHIFVSFNESNTGGLLLFGLVLNIPTYKIHMCDWTITYLVCLVHTSKIAANKCRLLPCVRRNPRSNWFKTIDGIWLSFTKNILRNLSITFPLVTWFSGKVSGTHTGMVLSDVLKKLKLCLILLSWYHWMY